MTKVQRNIRRALFDPQDEEPGTSSLYEGLDASADTLVERGLLWKKEGHRGRHPKADLCVSPKGIAVAQAAWQDA